MTLPFPWRAKPPSDHTLTACAQILLEPSDPRDRLVGDAWGGHDKSSVEQLEQAFELAVQAQPLLDRLRHSGVKDWRLAHGERGHHRRSGAVARVRRSGGGSRHRGR